MIGYWAFAANALFVLLIFLMLRSVHTKNSSLERELATTRAALEEAQAGSGRLLRTVHDLRAHCGELDQEIRLLHVRIACMKRVLIEVPLPPDLGAPLEQRTIFLPRLAQKHGGVCEVLIPGIFTQKYLLHRDVLAQEKSGDRDIIYAAIRASPHARAELGLYIIS